MAKKKTDPAIEPAAVDMPSHSNQEQTAEVAHEPGDDSQKSWVERASIIVDPEAGVKFAFDYVKHQAIITFDEKPTTELLAVARPILNDGGFQWDKVNKDGWKKKIAFTQREEDRRQAKKTYHTLANTIRKDKGLPARSFGEALAS